jgi:hypothetical protein
MVAILKTRGNYYINNDISIPGIPTKGDYLDIGGIEFKITKVTFVSGSRYARIEVVPTWYGGMDVKELAIIGFYKND